MTIFFLLAAYSCSASDYIKPTQNELKHAFKANKSVIGIVEKIFGNSFARQGDKGARSNINLGYRVFERDQIMTEKSRLHTRFKNGSYFELGEETKIDVERLRFKTPGEADDSIYRFHYGVVRVVVNEVQKLENFVIKTSVGFLKIVGPVDFYLIQLEGAPDMTVRVSKGSLELMNAVTNERLTVREKQAAYLKTSGLVTDAGLFTEDQRKFLESRTQI